MNSLAEKKCVPCRGDEPKLTENELVELSPIVPDWQIISPEGISQLTRTFKFRNFIQALDFTNTVGQIAEEQNHHPMLVTEWGKVTVTWWTHSIGGLHLNDFIMADKTDKKFEAAG
jgi:4a-hydroxytetrahydrobiopterin dehydratase